MTAIDRVTFAGDKDCYPPSLVLGPGSSFRPPNLLGAASLSIIALPAWASISISSRSAAACRVCLPAGRPACPAPAANKRTSTLPLNPLQCASQPDSSNILVVRVLTSSGRKCKEMHTQEFLLPSDSSTSRAFFASSRIVVQSRACVFQNIFFPVYINSINSKLCFNVCLDLCNFLLVSVYS